MLIEDQHPDSKSIMLAVLGAPNVGKSSLINYMLGTDLSIVTNRPQTTRNRFHCVLTIDHTEIILVDTPGMHKSNLEFNKRMNDQARGGSAGADINLLLIDMSHNVLPQFQEFARQMVGEELAETWVVFSKSDLIKSVDSLPLEEILVAAKEFVPSISTHYLLSSKTGDNVHQLIGDICDRAPESPHHYLDGDISNRNERFFATEYIREQAFELLKEELPYELAVLIEEYHDFKGKDKAENVDTHISAAILVNRPSQRGIVVGKQGSMIKEIGTRARKKISTMTGGKVHLNLHVKVSPKWFKNNWVLEEIGLPRAANSNRVWRAK